MKPAQIVIIEDNPADIFLVELALEENGVIYELTKFKNGRDALAALCPPDGAATFVPDVILLDLNTPRSDGFQVLTMLKQSPHLARTPMAVLTSSQAMSDKRRASLEGARYILKPAELREFLATVGQAVKEMIAQGAASKIS